jgi:hypothetical protein
MKTVLRQRWDNKEWGLANIGIYMSDEARTAAFDAEATQYCSQNNQDCMTCSLGNYGRDCHDNLIKGDGRK